MSHLKTLFVIILFIVGVFSAEQGETWEIKSSIQHHTYATQSYSKHPVSGIQLPILSPLSKLSVFFVHLKVEDSRYVTLSAVPTTNLPAPKVPSPIPAISSPPTIPVSTADALVAAWTETAQCETGQDWTMVGPVYSGGLGISDTNWVAYGGLEFSQNAGYATPYQQCLIASRIQSNPPDVTSCNGSW